MRSTLTLAVVAVLAAGCGSGSRSGSGVAATTSSTTPASSSTSPTTETAAATQTLRIYFLRDGLVAPVERRVPATPAVARAVLEALVGGPSIEERGEGLRSDVPHDTELRGVTIADGQATVDFSEPFGKGAEASLAARFAQVVYTLTQFPSVQSVHFEVEGEPLPTVTDGAGAPLDHAPNRADYEALTPAILVERPLPGQSVSSPFTITGTANTFEATFQVEVRTASGEVVTKRFVTATSGSGQRGTFRAEVPVDADAGPITLVVYEDSAESGKRTHQVELPLRLSG